MSNLTLEAIEQELMQPFAPEDVKLLPKAPRKNEKGEWVCLALAYADKRAYEDRLNKLAFGYWSTPYNPPYAVGNKLVIPVTVVVCGVAHTDYGESFLSSLTRKGEVYEEENSATEAYSQGFRRACAHFRLGRYFYSLPQIWVPYNPEKKAIALSDEQKRNLIMRLYKQIGLLSPPAKQEAVTEQHPQSATEPLASVQETSLPNGKPTTGQQTDTKPQEADKPFNMKKHQRQWLEQQLQHNEVRIQRVCTQYKVASLDELTNEQFTHLANRIFVAQKKNKQSQSNARTNPSHKQAVKN